MKRLNITFAFIFSLMLIASLGFAQQTDKDMSPKKQQMMEMMQDSTMPAMMMEHMAENPEMRKQMMKKMMDGNMDQSKMKQMMKKNPQMKRMMQRHMMCMQMMQGDKMDMNADSTHHGMDRDNSGHHQ